MATTTKQAVPQGSRSETLDQPPRIHFRSNFSIVEGIGYAILWMILGIITLGIAFFVFPYYVEKHVLNKIEAVNRDGETVGRLVCTVNIGQAIGHALLWLVLSILTLGLAGLVYAFVLTAYTMKHSQIEPV